MSKITELQQEVDKLTRENDHLREKLEGLEFDACAALEEREKRQANDEFERAKGVL